MRPLSNLFVLSLLAIAGATGQRSSSAEEEKLKYTVIYSDASGESHFRDESLPWIETKSSDPAFAGLLQTAFLDAQKIGFLRIHKDYAADFHQPPSKRFVLILSGAEEVQTTDGARRKFAAGDILLYTDLQGRGHRAIPLNGAEVLIAWVPVP